ncbi:trypsin-like peptidase domain-containing protein [Ruminococcus sp.]|uniref:S1C family serine protease n=1 Tax=Ruminococcus sp. TaxID=41978 RepID=UPI003870D22E
MSDNLYENLHFPEDDENTEPLRENAQHAAESVNVPDSEPVQKAEPEQQSAEVQSPEPVQQFAEVQEQRPYVDPYAGRVSYQQPAQPVQNAYQNPYRSADAPSYSRPEPAPTPTPSQPNQSMNDGFYHYTPRSTENSRNIYSGAHYTPQRPENTWNTANAANGGHNNDKKSGGGMSKGGIALLLVICILISGLAGFGGSILAQKLKASKYESNDTGTMVIHKVETEKEDAEKTVDKSTETITNEVADTVVEITTEVMQTSSFYGQYIAQGAGSGVIISKDGYIVTNNHVISGASSIKVTTRGGDSYDAKLVGTDAKVDIALLKIEASDLPVAVFGDSSKLAVGAKAVIIGNPLGTLGGSVTEGIISALDRSIVIDGKTMHLMQTDAAVNPGNSGGGMFDGQGALSGIVVAKSSSEEIDNIGFVIPINDVIEIIDDLKDYGYVRGRADTGMTFMDLSNNMFAWYYFGTNEAGVYIASVENGSNAAKAGFAKGDRVVSIDGKEITKSEEITNIISDKSAGDKVTFEIDRSGSKKTIELTLDEDVPDQNNTNSNSQSNNNNGNGGSQGGNPFGGMFGNR